MCPSVRASWVGESPKVDDGACVTSNCSVVHGTSKVRLRYGEAQMERAKQYLPVDLS